jgi:hypothetical protein
LKDVMTGAHLVFSTYLETKARRGHAEVVSFYRVEALSCKHDVKRGGTC